MTAPHPRVILQKEADKTTENLSFFDRLRRKAADANQRVLMPEFADVRVLSAAAFLVRMGISRPVLVGDPGEVRVTAERLGCSLEGIGIDDLSPEERRACAERLFERRRAKGLTMKGALSSMEDPLHRTAAMLRMGRGDGFVGGAVRSTADTVRAALAQVGAADGARTVFGAMLMECPHAAGGSRRLLFADAAVAPDPSPRALSETAAVAAKFFAFLTGETPRIAFLSFSTKGSAEDESAKAMRDAAELARKKHPALAVDGELQGDAALVDHIAAQKGLTDFSVAGRANVLIFPDLNSGNIAYKLVQHLGGARAVGPTLLGLAKPMCDLSRGCTDEDIVDAAAVVSVMAKE